MFDTILGLPLHPLVVHAVIVFMPLAALGAVLMAARRSWNLKYGWLVLICAFVATGSAFVAKESGEKLGSRMGFPPEHIEWGKRAPVVSAFLFVVLLILWLLDRREERRTALGKVVAVVTVLAAVLVAFVAFQAGHTGATAAWKSTIDKTKVGTIPEP